MLTKMLLKSPRICTRCFSNSKTIDSNELQHFGQLSAEWWNPIGPFRGLHALNKLRVPLIRDGLINANIVAADNINSPLPLKDIKILDVGCGGGILSESLARIGGNITGLDATPDSIEKAKSRLESQNLQTIQYLCTSIEDHAEGNSEKYDAVVASEVLEHVSHKQEFLKACIRCLKPKGSIFLTTINKNWLSNITAIWISENLSLVPKGTHEYEKFIEPHVLQRFLEEANCKTVLLHGMFYNFLSNEWSWTANHDICYAIHAIKLSDC